jgi:hypothetical protein
MKKRYLMKKNSFIVLFLLCNFFAFAQPTTITYQGKLLDNSDMPVNELAVAFTFAIYDAESGGNKIWPPSNPVATKSIDIVNGLYSVILGTGSGNDQAIEPSIFNGITPYLEVGVNATTLPRTPITSVPFSIISNNLSSSAWASPGAIGSATPNSGTFTALTVGTTTNTYTFPSEDGNGGQVLTTDGSGGASWATPSAGGLTNFTESNYTYDSKTGVKLLATNAATNVDVVLQPKGNGGILAQQPDGAVTGGNNRGINAVDLQMGRSENTQVASGYFSTLGGGYDNAAGGHYSSVGGGFTNTANVIFSTIGGGQYNTASGSYSTVGGGNSNRAIGHSSTLGGGYDNTASGDFSTVGGGGPNTASGIYSTVGGGLTNTAEGHYSSVGGGSTNTASVIFSTIGGGQSNTASGSYSTVGGGYSNRAIGHSSTLGGGYDNTASGNFSSVGGGLLNSGSGDYSFTVGNNNTAQSYGESVLGLFATVGSGTATSTVTTDRLFVVGNGTDISARSNALTILKNGNTTVGGSLSINGNGTDASVAFPTGRGTNNQVLTTDGSGGTTWATPSAGSLTNFTESNYTFNTKTGVKLLATNAAEDVDVVLQPKGIGGILAQQPDGALAGGNNRGTNAVDLQMLRTANTQVASGDYSTVGGGQQNTASGDYSTVGGGQQNTASYPYATLGGGNINTASGHYSTLGGGFTNSANGTYSTLGGGRTNVASGFLSTLGGGLFNIASATKSIVAGGEGNIASGELSTIGGGSTNTASSNSSTVGGGIFNTASGDFSAVGGGFTNTAGGSYSFTVGNNNTAQSYGESVLGLFATVGSGTATSTVTTDRLFVVGNGTADTRSNALTMLKNGNTTIGGSLSINGNGTDASVAFPTGRGTNNQVLTTDGSGGTTWATPYTGLTNFTESNYTFNTKTGVKLLANNAATDVDVVLQPKGIGGILAQQPDGALAGGNNRGTNAVDLQMGRSENTQVASGYASTIGGGDRNTASGYEATVSGGYNHIASGPYSIIGGGSTNTASSNSSTVGGGIFNTVSGNFSAVGGGHTNAASGLYSIIGGGHTNAASGDFSAVGGGDRNTASEDFSTVSGGYNHIASGYYSTIGGGSTNTASSNSSTVGGGIFNTASGDFTAIGGGISNQANGSHSSVGGGFTNTAGGSYSFTVGNNNTAQSYGESVLGLFATVGSGTATSTVTTDRLFVVGNGTGTSARSNALTILKNGNTTVGGSLSINGNGTDASVAFPTGRGTNNQVLTTDGSGGTTWATPNQGTITSVTGTAPISSTGGATPAISIIAATTSAAGSMSAADKTKLDGIATSANNYEHPTGDGILHVPATGTTNSGKVLTAGATAGSLSWETPSGAATLTIGQSYQGGIIFWLDATGQHGLIAATADQSIEIHWYNGTHRYTGTTGDGLYAGAMNTSMIVATQMADNQTGNFAAKVCADYSVTVSGVTYGDWYLPSIYELNLLSLQRAAVGGFASAFYWSSSEYNNLNAWGYDFAFNLPGFTNKVNADRRVRAVRAF